MKYILLLRHGSTKANEKFLYCGKTDIGLTDKGKTDLLEKSEHYQKRLSLYQKPDAVNVKYFTSGMKRTNETAEILFNTRNYVCLPGFQEINFGIYEMKSYEELKDRQDYKEWISGDFYSNVPKGGGSGNQMKERVLAAFDKLSNELVAEPEEMMYVLVCHGGVIAAVMEHLFPDYAKNLYEWQPKRGCGYLLTYSDTEDDKSRFSSFEDFS